MRVQQRASRSGVFLPKPHLKVEQEKRFMPGDPASRNDDELLSQIDELKARMDRLMRGGTSTSNSALLTDAARAQQTEAALEAPTSAV